MKDILVCWLGGIDLRAIKELGQVGSGLVAWKAAAGVPRSWSSWWGWRAPGESGAPWCCRSVAAVQKSGSSNHLRPSSGICGCILASGIRNVLRLGF